MPEAVEKQPKGDNLWQLKLGKLFGEMMIEVNEFITQEPDQAVIKAKLAEMRKKLPAASSDFPPEIRSRSTEMSGYADAPDFFAEKNLTPFLKLVIETPDIISPEKINGKL